MAYSTTSDFTMTGTDVVTEALELLGVLAEGESPSADQQTSCLRTLNMLIKTWSAEYNIYAQKEFFTLLNFESQDQSIISGTKGHWDIMEMGKVATAYTSTDTTITLDNALSIDNYGYAIADLTMYVFTSSAMYTADIASEATATYTLDAALGVDLSVGDLVWILPTTASVYFPTKLYTLGIVDGSTGQYTELAEVSQSDLYRSQGASRPNAYYQKRELDPAGYMIRVNPAPDNYLYFLKGWAQYKIRDMDAIGNDVYFPAEWFLALAYGLAYLLANKYGIHPSDRDRLRKDMEEFRWEASTYDRDGSVYFQPSDSKTTAFRRDDDGTGA